MQSRETRDFIQRKNCESLTVGIVFVNNARWSNILQTLSDIEIAKYMNTVKSKIDQDILDEVYSGWFVFGGHFVLEPVHQDIKVHC